MLSSIPRRLARLTHYAPGVLFAVATLALVACDDESPVRSVLGLRRIESETLIALNRDGWAERSRTWGEGGRRGGTLASEARWELTPDGMPTRTTTWEEGGARGGEPTEEWVQTYDETGEVLRRIYYGEGGLDAAAPRENIIREWVYGERNADGFEIVTLYGLGGMGADPDANILRQWVSRPYVGEGTGFRSTIYGEGGQDPDAPDANVEEDIVWTVDEAGDTVWWANYTLYLPDAPCENIRIARSFAPGGRVRSWRFHGVDCNQISQETIYSYDGEAMIRRTKYGLGGDGVGEVLEESVSTLDSEGRIVRTVDYEEGGEATGAIVGITESDYDDGADDPLERRFMAYALPGFDGVDPLGNLEREVVSLYEGNVPVHIVTFVPPSESVE